MCTYNEKVNAIVANAEWLRVKKTWANKRMLCKIDSRVVQQHLRAACLEDIAGIWEKLLASGCSAVRKYFSAK